MIYRFYKENDKWYIDLPAFIEAGGTVESLEMVGGADTFLESMSYKYFNKAVPIKDHTYGPSAYQWEQVRESVKEINLEVSINPSTEFETLMRSSEDGEGAWYIDIRTGHILWLCPVTEWLFGHYPSFIYYKIIEK